MTWETVALVAVIGLLAYLFRQSILVIGVVVFLLCVITFAAICELFERRA